jgi:hypothetical protein
MSLAREQPKIEREPHRVVPIHGEFGRYTVNSRSAAKKGHEEAYIVDVLAVEETNVGPVTGTCPCKGWSVRKTCSHLIDAMQFHEQLAVEKLGFEKLD